MTSFEEQIKANVLSSGKSDPPETDLDYYSKPENYTGSNLQSLQRFQIAKTKQERELNAKKKTKKKKKDGFDLFKRYRHILKGLIEDEGNEPDTSEDEEEEDEAKRNTNGVDPSKSSHGDTVRQLSGIIEREEHPTTDARVSSASGRNASPSLGLPESPFDLGRVSPASEADSLGSSISLSRKKSSMVPMVEGGQRQSVLLKKKLEKEMRARMAREKFRRAYRVVKAVNILSAAAGKDVSIDSGLKTLSDIASEAETTSQNLKNSGLSFDPNYFKAKKEVAINISSEVKSILSLPSEERTPEQIQTAMYGLQSLRSFAEYPLHMQEKLAKVAWYEVVSPKKIIIRQGHYAENFYFILSGQAVVTILLRNPKTGASFVKTATIMRKGMSFGELALLHHSRRTATVTSQGAVQLLTIGRQDFFDIFMSGTGDDIPEHIKFISQCDFMKEWPIEKLVENPQYCLLHFFKRNVLIVKDSNESEWLYVVKSGSCQVLKELKDVKAKIGLCSNSRGNPEHQIPNFGIKAAEPKVDTGLRKRRKEDSAPEAEEEEDPNKENQENKKQRENTPPGEKHFSKRGYCGSPDTQKAYFSAIQNKLQVRKNYKVPSQCKPQKTPVPPKEATGKPQPVFVQVETLKPKDVFGLETIDFDDGMEDQRTSVSLVSRGAECIMLSKEFFIKHANEKVRIMLRNQIQPYPDENTFQSNLQIKADWELYKHQLVNDLTSRI